MEYETSANSALNVALKEWNLVISALLSGRQAVLLRKGGILEAENQFELEHSQFLFFPTFVHQDPRMVKAEFRTGLKNCSAEPDQVEIRGWGEVARIIEVPTLRGRERLEALEDLHIWDAPLLDMRFAYRPEKPLYLVVIRAFRLNQPCVIPNTLEYAGCKSWVPLKAAIDVTQSLQAIESETLNRITERIARIFQS